MARFARLLVAAALIPAVFGPATTVHAQAPLAPLFTVPGAINQGSLGTFFVCTNTDTAPVTIGVELFGQGGTSLNNPNTTAVSLGTQASILIGTQASAALTVDVALNTAAFSKGSAHILTTSKKVVCSAFLADPTTNPPVSMTTLTMAYKGKQKGD